MINRINTSRIFALTLIVLLAAGTRAFPLLIPHIWNFTAVGALAVFAGAKFKDGFLTFLIPIAAMAISDIFIPFGYSPIVYTGFILMVACGYIIRNRVTPTSVGLASISGALVFFLVTNFAFFYPQTVYPHNIHGILQSYVMGLPFLKNMLIADLVYGTILFYGFHFLEKRYPVLALK